MNRDSNARRDIVLWSSSLLVVALTLVIAAAAALAEAGTRVLHFPPDKSLGTVSIQDVNQLDWDRLGPAQGDVTIPDGKRTWLNVSGEAFENLEAIENLGPNDLYRLNLSSTRLCDDDLSRTRVMGTGFSHLAGLTSLKSSNLSQAPVTNAGLAGIARLPNLGELGLHHCPVENSAVAHLAGMRSLRGLEIGRTHIDEEGLAQLEKALPNCEIGWTIPRVKLGEPAPEIVSVEFIQAPSDAVATWDALKGNVVVVEFWATWCGPCVQSIPHLNELVDHFHARPVRFISITNEEEAVVEGFLKDNTLKAWIAVDPESVVNKAYKVYDIPCCALVDRNGVIRKWCHPSELTEADIQALLDE